MEEPRAGTTSAEQCFLEMKVELEYQLMVHLVN